MSVPIEGDTMIINAVESFVLAKEADGRADRTIRDYHRVLGPFSEWCDNRGLGLGDLDRDAVRRYVRRLRRRDWSDATVAIHIRNLKTFLRWCYDEGRAEENLARALKSPKTHRREELPLTVEEIGALIDACQGDEQALRDRALILTFIDTGLRLGEMPTLRRDDVNVNGDGRAWLRVYGSKNGQWRFAILGQRTTRAINRYLETRRDVDPALWMGRRGPLASEGMYRAIKKRAGIAGIKKRVHPHLFRKTFATAWLDNSGDPERLRILAGWSTATMADMLEIYVTSNRDRLEAAHAKAGPVDNMEW